MDNGNTVQYEMYNHSHSGLDITTDRSQDVTSLFTWHANISVKKAVLNPATQQITVYMKSTTTLGNVSECMKVPEYYRAWIGVHAKDGTYNRYMAYGNGACTISGTVYNVIIFITPGTSGHYTVFKPAYPINQAASSMECTFTYFACLDNRY